MTEACNYAAGGLLAQKQLQVEKLTPAYSVGTLTAYWTYEYEKGRLMKEWSPADSVFDHNAPVYTYTYDALKRPIKMTTPSGISGTVEWVNGE